LRNLPEFRPLSGGRAIELAASKSTDPQAFEFPMVMSHYRDCNFSVAGIKNTVRRHILQQEKLHGTVQLKVLHSKWQQTASVHILPSSSCVFSAIQPIQFAQVINPFFPEVFK
jgi:tRNA A37 threonylcarbamoyltransferase TsaD